MNKISLKRLKARTCLYMEFRIRDRKFNKDCGP